MSKKNKKINVDLNFTSIMQAITTLMGQIQPVVLDKIEFENQEEQNAVKKSRNLANDNFEARRKKPSFFVRRPLKVEHYQLRH